MAQKFVIKKVLSTEFDTPVVLTEADRKVAPFMALEVYREMAWKNYNRAEYEAATRNFNIAVGINPEDRRTIIGRGFSRSKNTLFGGALQDAETVLRQNPLDKEGIYLQALAKYELGDFEEGLRAFYNGMNKRGKRPMFVGGRYQTEGTIEDCIGRYAGPMLTNMKTVVRLMELKRLKDERRAAVAKKCVDNLDIPPPHPCTDAEWNRYILSQERLSNVMGEKYLGKLNDDKKWLKKTLKNPNMVSANKDGAKKLFVLGETALGDIANRQEILRSRKPFYHFSFLVEDCVARLENDRIKKDKEKRRVNSWVVAKMMEELKKKRMETKTKRCVEIAERLKQVFDRVPGRLLPNKKAIRKEFFNTIGLVYLDMKKFKPFLSLKENYKRLIYLLGFDGAYKDVKQEPLVQETKFPFWNYKAWLQKYDDYLRFTDDPLERAWIYHETGRCYGEMHKYEHMALRGRKCLWAAKEAKSIIWIINGLHMVIMGEMNFHQKDEALKAFRECLGYALRYEDESIIRYLLLCGEIINEKDIQEAFEDANTVIRKREELMLSLMHDANIQERAKNLFQRMRVMATRRRMSVVPGMVPKHTRLTNKHCMSIIPGGTGGRLGLHPVGEETLDEFIDLTSQDIIHCYF